MERRAQELSKTLPCGNVLKPVTLERGGFFLDISAGGVYGV